MKLPLCCKALCTHEGHLSQAFNNQKVKTKGKIPGISRGDSSRKLAFYTPDNLVVTSYDFTLEQVIYEFDGFPRLRVNCG